MITDFTSSGFDVLQADFSEITSVKSVFTIEPASEIVICHLSVLQICKVHQRYGNVRNRRPLGKTNNMTSIWPQLKPTRTLVSRTQSSSWLVWWDFIKYSKKTSNKYIHFEWPTKESVEPWRLGYDSLWTNSYVLHGRFSHISLNFCIREKMYLCNIYHHYTNNSPVGGKK